MTGRLGRGEMGSGLKTRHLAPFVDPSADLSHFAFRALPAGCRDPFVSVSQSFPRHWSFIRPRTGEVSSAYGCRPRRSLMHGIRTLFRLPVFFVSPFFVSIFLLRSSVLCNCFFHCRLREMSLELRRGWREEIRKIPPFCCCRCLALEEGVPPDRAEMQLWAMAGYVS